MLEGVVRHPLCALADHQVLAHGPFQAEEGGVGGLRAAEIDGVDHSVLHLQGGIALPHVKLLQIRCGHEGIALYPLGCAGQLHRLQVCAVAEGQLADALKLGVGQIHRLQGRAAVEGVGLDMVVQGIREHHLRQGGAALESSAVHLPLDGAHAAGQHHPAKGGAAPEGGFLNGQGVGGDVGLLQARAVPEGVLFNPGHRLRNVDVGDGLVGLKGVLHDGHGLRAAQMGRDLHLTAGALVAGDVDPAVPVVFIDKIPLGALRHGLRVHWGVLRELGSRLRRFALGLGIFSLGGLTLSGLLGVLPLAAHSLSHSLDRLLKPAGPAAAGDAPRRQHKGQGRSGSRPLSLFKHTLSHDNSPPSLSLSDVTLSGSSRW